MINVPPQFRHWVHEDLPHYEANDIILAKQFPEVYNRPNLYEMLEQPYVVIPKGVGYLKPSISLHGLGSQVVQLNTDTQLVYQPMLEGEYLNVDGIRLDATTYRFFISKAHRTERHFHWFKPEIEKTYNLQYFHRTGDDHLTTKQLDALRVVASLVPHRQPFNVEFIGDQVLEAHARWSLETASLFPHQWDTLLDPTWNHPTVTLVNHYCFVFWVRAEDACEVLLPEDVHPLRIARPHLDKSSEWKELSVQHLQRRLVMQIATTTPNMHYALITDYNNDQ